MNTLRNLLVSIAVILGAAVIGVDHYMTNVYLREFVETRTYHNEQLAKILAAEDSARLGNNLATLAQLQGVRVSELEAHVRKLLEAIEGYKVEIKIRDAVIKASAQQIDSLSKDTTVLQKENDEIEFECRKAKDQVEVAKKEIAKLTKELELLKIKLEKAQPSKPESAPTPKPEPVPAPTS